MNKTSEDIYFHEFRDSPEGERVYKAYQLLEAEEFDEARVLLNELDAGGNAAAAYLSCSFSSADEKIEDYERRHLQQLQKSAELGFPPALHKLAIYFDTGEYIDRDVVKAARLFKRAAELGHPHAQWIHGVDLLYGRNGIAKDEKLGVWYIDKAAAVKFEGAMETLASFYGKGLIGFERNLERASQLRRQIESNDVIGF